MYRPSSQAPQSFTTGGGWGGPTSPLIAPPSGRAISMVKCPVIPGAAPLATVWGTIDGQTPTQNDIGKRIMYTGQGGSNNTFEVTNVSVIAVSQGSVPTPFVSTTQPCPIHANPAHHMHLAQCGPNGSLPVTVQPITTVGLISSGPNTVGQSPTQNDVGTTIQTVSPTQGAKFKVMWVGGPSNSPGQTFMPSPTPCVSASYRCDAGGCLQCPPGVSASACPHTEPTCNNSCMTPTSNIPTPSYRKSPGRGRETAIRKGRGLSDVRMNKYKDLEG